MYYHQNHSKSYPPLQEFINQTYCVGYDIVMVTWGSWCIFFTISIITGLHRESYFDDNYYLSFTTVEMYHHISTIPGYHSKDGVWTIFFLSSSYPLAIPSPLSGIFSHLHLEPANWKSMNSGFLGLSKQ